MTFIDKDEKSHTYEVASGDNLLDIAQENDLEMEGMLGGGVVLGLEGGGLTVRRSVRWFCGVLDVPCYSRGRSHVREDPRA